MPKMIGAAFVSLDGVMQGPGAPEEDTTGDLKVRVLIRACAIPWWFFHDRLTTVRPRRYRERTSLPFATNWRSSTAMRRS